MNGKQGTENRELCVSTEERESQELVFSRNLLLGDRRLTWSAAGQKNILPVGFGAASLEALCALIEMGCRFFVNVLVDGFWRVGGALIESQFERRASCDSTLRDTPCST